MLHHFDICVPYVPLIFFFTIQSLFFSFIVYHWSFNKNKKTVPLSAARITYPSDSFGSFTIFSWVVVAGFCFLLIIVCLVVHFLRPLYCMFFGHCIVCSSVIVLYVLRPLYCMFFGHCIVCSSAIVLYVLRPLYCMFFGHCIVCSSAMVLCVLRPLYCMFFGHYIVCSSAIVLYVLLSLSSD